MGVTFGLTEIIGAVVAVLLAGSWFRGNYHKSKAERAETRAEVHRGLQYKAEEELKRERDINKVKEEAYEAEKDVVDTVGTGSDRVDLGVYEHGDKIRHD